MKNNFLGEIVYEKGSPAIYHLDGVSGLSSGNNEVVSKTRVPVVNEGTKKWSDWGDDNLFPLNVDTDIRQNAIVTRGLEVLIQTHFGKGVQTYIEEPTEEGKLIKKIVFDQTIDDFFKQSNIKRLIPQLIYDYVWFRNIFPELIFDKGGSKISLIKRQDPIHCRWEKTDNKGNIKNLFISTKWPDPKDVEFEIIQALDVDFPLMDLNNLKIENKIKAGQSIVMPVRTNTGGNIYYDKTPWDAIRTQWLPIATNVPKMKLALLENQMSIKYHVKVPYSFWERKYGESEWAGYTKSVQSNLIKEWRVKLDKYLMGIENTGKSFISFYDRDMLNNKIYDEIIIEVIDDKMADKKWLTESQAANSENLFAIGVDPTIIGQSSPGGSEGGSGSNKREAFAILQALQGIPRSMVFSVLELVRDFNGWNPKIQFGHIDLDTSQTIDKNPTGKQTQLN